MFERYENGGILYTGCGLDYIVLLNGYEIVEDDGEEFVSIPQMESLHQAIADWIVTERPNLDGRDIKFLRGVLNLSQVALARALNITRQAIIGWERGGDKDVASPGERAVRLLYSTYRQDNDFTAKLVQRLQELDREDERRIERIEYMGNHWLPKRVQAG